MVIPIRRKARRVRIWACLLSCMFSLVLNSHAADHGAMLQLTTEEYPPYNFRNDEGELDGISTRAIREALRRADIEASIQLLPWARAFTAARLRAGHCVFSTSRTPEREANFQWVGPLATNHWVAFSLHDRVIDADNLQDLAGLRVGTYREDAIAQYAEEEGIEVLLTSVDRDNVQRLQSGVIDVWLTGAEMGQVMAKQEGVALRTLFTFNQTGVFLACNPGVPTAQLDRLQTAIDEMHADGTLSQIRSDVYERLALEPIHP